MSRRILSTALAIAFAVILAGCGEDEATQPEPVASGDIMPLEVGNRWDYEVYAFPGSGTPYKYLDSILIVGIDTTDDVISFVANGEDWFLNQNNGLWYLPDTAADWSLMFKYPAAVNDLWITGGYSEFVMWVASTNAKVETPFGDYICYKYVRESRYGGGHAGYFYLVPDIGIVQYEYLDSSNIRIEERGQLTALHLVE